MEAGPSEYHLGLLVAQMFQVSLFFFVLVPFGLNLQYSRMTMEKFKLVDYLKIGYMYLSKYFLFEIYVLRLHCECLKVLLYQLPYVLKQP